MRMWQTIRTLRLERHVHNEPYAALVISGGYEEAGDNGYFVVRAGNVVFHDRFDAHLDRFPAQGAAVLNLRLAWSDSFKPGIATVADPDRVVRAAEKSRTDAIDLLYSMTTECVLQSSDWPDKLATELMRNQSLKLSQWGERNGLAPWTISRGFARVFGISPEAFRARVRARRALKWIQNTKIPLATIAAELVFADQAHMTRSIQRLTGLAPQLWRSAANEFKTGKLPIT